MSSNANDNGRKRKNSIEGLELGFEGILNKKRAIAETVQCCVCFGIVVKAVSLVPCGHSLCQSCWIEAVERCRLPWNESVENMNSPTCPPCRQPVTSYVVAYTVRHIVAALVAVSPEVFEANDVDAYHKANGSVSVVHDDVPIDNDHRYEATEAPEANVGRRRNDRGSRNSINAAVLETTGEGEGERNDHRYEATEAPEANVGRRRNDRGSRNSINAAVLETTGEGEGERNAPNATNRRNREATHDISSISMLVHEILRSDRITFDRAFHALRVELLEDSTIWDHVVAVAMLPLMWLVVSKTVRWIFKE
jgi:hypothetical protein